MKGHIYQLDYLKAIAIIAVVFYHSLGYYAQAVDHAFYGCTAILGVLHSFHMPLFFLIAGFLCHVGDVRTFFSKKINRILLPFVFFSLLKIAYRAFVDGDFVGIETFYSAFLCGQYYWFPVCLAGFYFTAVLYSKFSALRGFVKKDIGVLSQPKSPGLIAI